MTFALSPLFLSFDGLCPQQEHHAVQTRGRSAAWKSPTSTPLHVFTQHSQRGRNSSSSTPRVAFSLFDTLFHLLSTQRHLLKFMHPARSLRPQTGTRVQGQGILHSVQTPCATAPLTEGSLFAEPDVCGCRQGLREEVRTVEKIYRLEPHLRSLRFMWGPRRRRNSWT